MDNRATRDHLDGCTLETHPDHALSISSSVIRADCAGVPLVAVGSERPLGDQIAGLLDALRFHRVRYPHHNGDNTLCAYLPVDARWRDTVAPWTLQGNLDWLRSRTG